VTAGEKGETVRNKRGEGTAPRRTTATTTVAAARLTASTQQQTWTQRGRGEGRSSQHDALGCRDRDARGQVSSRRSRQSMTSFRRCLTSNGPLPEAREQAWRHADKMRDMRH